MAVKESLASAPTPFSLPLSFSLSTPIGLWEGAFGNRRSCHEYVVGRGRRCHFARRIQFLSNATSLPFRRRAPPSFGETARNFSWRPPRRAASVRPSVRPLVSFRAFKTASSSPSAVAVTSTSDDDDDDDNEARRLSLYNRVTNSKQPPLRRRRRRRRRRRPWQTRKLVGTMPVESSRGKQDWHC